MGSGNSSTVGLPASVARRRAVVRAGSGLMVQVPGERGPRVSHHRTVTVHRTVHYSPNYSPNCQFGKQEKTDFWESHRTVHRTEQFGEEKTLLKLNSRVLHRTVGRTVSSVGQFGWGLCLCLLLGHRTDSSVVSSAKAAGFSFALLIELTVQWASSVVLHKLNFHVLFTLILFL